MLGGTQTQVNESDKASATRKRRHVALTLVPPPQPSKEFARSPSFNAEAVTCFVGKGTLIRNSLP